MNIGMNMEYIQFKCLIQNKIYISRVAYDTEKVLCFVFLKYIFSAHHPCLKKVCQEVLDTIQHAAIRHTSMT